MTGFTIGFITGLCTWFFALFVCSAIDKLANKKQDTEYYRSRFYRIKALWELGKLSTSECEKAMEALAQDILKEMEK